MHKSILTVIFCLASGLAAAVPSPQKPNILLILADDMGWGESSCQGNSQIPTPHIDSLAQNGVRFTSGYVSCPYCSPSRAGLMTGRYQQRYGHEFNPGYDQFAPDNFGLPLEEIIMPQRLKAAGYVTGMFGKWHLGYKPQYHPMQRGFDEYFGFVGGMHDYFDAIADPSNPILQGTTPVSAIGYTTDDFARETVQFIEKHKDQPWFVYLPFNAVHAPMQAKEKHLAQFSSIADKKRRAFAGMLSAMDDAIGDVLGVLRRNQLEENTLIVFLSDNGGPTHQTTASNGPLRGGKTQTWEGGIRIPFLMQWKTMIRGGQVYDHPIIQLDVLPTALAAAGVQIDPAWKLDGVNLLPYLVGGKKEPPHEALYWRLGQRMAIRMGDWKLVKGGVPGDSYDEPGKFTMDGASLYHLTSDIGETRDLAQQEPEKFRQLAEAWNKWNQELVEPKWYPGRPAKQPKDAKQPLPKENGHAAEPQAFPYVLPDKRPNLPLSMAMERLYTDYPAVRPEKNELFSNFKYTRLDGFDYHNHDGTLSRRDPSKIIRANGKYYVWYTHRHTSTPPQGPGRGNDTMPSSDWDLAEIWYATSDDGFTWQEQGVAVPRPSKPQPGWRAVCTPDILVWKGKYYLYYQGFLEMSGVRGDDCPVTASVANSPDGPWHPVGKIIIPNGADGQWDRYSIHDPYPLVYRGKIYLYYKSDFIGGKPRDYIRAQGLAIADDPLGPFTKHPLNPIMNSGHETTLFPFKQGIAALISRNGMEHNTIQFAPDGVNFKVVTTTSLMPTAAGPYVPDAFTDTKDGRGITWGLSHFINAGNRETRHSILARFDCDLSQDVYDANMKQTDISFKPEVYFLQGLDRKQREQRESDARRPQ